MMLQFKEATIQDLPVIVEIYNSTIAGRMVTADTETVSIKSRMNWLESHHSKRPLWMILNDESIIGWLSFQDFYGRPAYNTTAEISIYLDEKQRGKGYGKAILKLVFDRCPGLGIHNIVGFIFEHNQPSLFLFEKMGFEQWGKLPGIAVLDGIERNLIIVGKKLNDKQ